MKSNTLKIIVAIIATPIIVVIYFIASSYFTYIDETITEGSGYGFTIGQTKEEAFLSAQELYKEEKVNFSNFYEYSQSTPKISFINKPLTEVDLELLNQFGTWKFNFNGRASDSVSLKFKDGKLSQILRDRHDEW